MNIPVLENKKLFCLDETILYGENELLNFLQTKVRERYFVIEAFISSDDFLSSVNEKQLFRIYDQLIKTDTIGFFGVNTAELLPNGESEEKLNSLVGLEPIKRSIKKIKAYSIANKNSKDLNLHMCFMGNPGTGKTEVARILSRILYENGVLSEAKLIETDSSGLIGKYVGETAPKTIAKVRDALGGVLFIDEAYALTDANSEKSSYGDEAVATLLKEMEDKRGKICVILAGYQDKMKQLLSSNPGFESRMQFTLAFPDYSSEELREIAETFIMKKGYTVTISAMDKITIK